MTPSACTLIVAGSRSIRDPAVVAQALTDCQAVWGRTVEAIVHGGARGVDRLAGAWAYDHGVPVVTFPVRPEQWARFGRFGPDNAAYRRNQAMAAYVVPDGGLLAIWDGHSRGTGHMIRAARALNLPVYIHRV